MALSWISGYNNINYLNQMIRSVEDTLLNDYNNLDNIPIIKIISSTSNPQNVWELKEGMYLIDGIVYVDNNTSYEVSNLFVSMTIRLENGKYVLSAFIPFFKGLYEYILKSDSTEYEEHQIVILATHERMLTRYNETPYEPNGDYNPATKKYVDDKANEIVTELDRIGVNKETTTSLKEENRIRDIKLQALLSETSDRNISISEDTRYFDMPLSIDNGIVTINEMIGDTLVNVCDQEKSVAITKSYTVENENHIALQGEYDGSCRPVVYGNTLVNHNADWDDSLQTGIETSASGTEDVQVEGIKGQEVSVVVEGNTVLNHALGKTSAVVDSIEETQLLEKPQLLRYFTDEGIKYNVSISASEPGQGTLYIPVIQNSNSNVYTLIVTMSDYVAGNCFISLRDNDNTSMVSNEVFINSNGEHVLLFKLTSNNFTGIRFLTESMKDNLYSINKNIKLLEGDHTTNPKYVNSNNGNYVDLTVANDMSSVVEIEGKTMVNVCDQKDPIAITKAYTVENSGNHIALQGEYDGKCRPVIQGNTMVNLIPNLSFKIQTFQGQYWRYNYFTLNQPTKANTVYTLIFDIIENTAEVTAFYFGGKAKSFELTRVPILGVGRHTVTATSISETYDHSQFYIQFQDIYEIGTFEVRIMLFEGDLTQTPELIPTEYVEGLKSSFEDNLVTQAMVDSGEESEENLGKYKVEYKVTGKNKFDINKINWVNTCVSITNNNIVISNSYTNHTYSTLRELGFKANTNYTISRKCDVTREDGETYVPGRIGLATTNTVLRNLLEWDKNSGTVTFTEDELDYGLIFYGHMSKVVTFSDVQIEESTEATEYETYKEYTKTFYLNSPLLEGDTIEDVNGVATHVKRYEKVVLDGSDDEVFIEPPSLNLDGYEIRYITLPNYIVPGNVIVDKFKKRISYSYLSEGEGIYFETPYFGTKVVAFYINSNKLNNGQFRKWLQANPTTVVYELASPIYEQISDEPILCDSYVNGHLDFDTNIPIKKVKFRYVPLPLKYVNIPLEYIVQFESDNVGKCGIAIGQSNWVGEFSVAKGINKFTANIVNPITNGTQYLYMDGIGFNASNIVVTEATDADFDYFEGLKSSYEYEVTEDGKYKVDVKVTGKNLIDKWIKGYVNSASGTPDTISPNSIRTDYIKLDSNLTYRIKGLDVRYRSFLSFYDKDKKWLGRTSGTFTSTWGIYKGRSLLGSYGILGDYEYLIVSHYDITEDVDTFIKNNTIQLEEGTTATSYEPYFESTKTFYLNSPLLEGDKIVTKNGKVYHYHKMGMVVFDGSEDWVKGSADNNGTTTISFYTKSITNVLRQGVTYSDILLTTNIKEVFVNNSENEYLLASLSSNDAILLRVKQTRLSTQDVTGFKQWLQANPTTVVYELASPYYELIDEYNNTILDIPNTVAHLTHTSAVPVNNTVFTNYKDELNVLEANTQYRLMFDIDRPCSSLNVTLGGTTVSCTSTTISGTKSFLITTPSTLVDKNLVIDGIGRCGIDNIRIFKGDVEYDYVKGLWSGYEERKLEPLVNIPVLVENATLSGYYHDYKVASLSKFKKNCIYTIIYNLDIQDYANGIYNHMDIGYGNDLQMLEAEYHLNIYTNNFIQYISKGLVAVKFCYTPKQNHANLYIRPIRCGTPETGKYIIYSIKNLLILEGDWTDNTPTYEEVMANEGKYAVKVKLDTNATIFGKGGRL